MCICFNRNFFGGLYRLTFKMTHSQYIIIIIFWQSFLEWRYKLLSVSYCLLWWWEYFHDHCILCAILYVVMFWGLRKFSSMKIVLAKAFFLLTIIYISLSCIHIVRPGIFFSLFLSFKSNLLWRKRMKISHNERKL